MENGETIRSFIAVELSGEAREELARIIGILKRAEADVKWMSPGSIHLTLKFLGDITAEKATLVAGRLKEIAAGIRPFRLVLGGIGVFPGWGHARVLWVGVSDGEKEAKELARSVEEEMAREAFEREDRAFSPHLTLGRVRTGKNKDKLKDLADSIDVVPAPSLISRIVLFRSVLTREGSIYTPLDITDLGK